MDAQRNLQEKITDVLRMEEENDALIMSVRRVLKGRPLCVKHMEEGNDVLT